MDDIRPAIVEGNLPLVMSHLDTAPNAETRRKRVGMVLTYSLTQNQQALISAMLKEDFDANQHLRSESMLMTATRFGQIDAAKALLARGADVNTADYMGETALSKAAEKGELEIVTLLLDQGADTGPIISEHGTPTSAIRRALNNGREHFAVVRALLEHGADANETIFRKPILSVLAEAKQAEIVQMAIERGADVNAQEERLGQTPLQCAAERGHAEIVEMLLKAGADADHHNRFGDTALSEAVERGHTDVVRALLEHGAVTVSETALSDRRKSLKEAVESGYCEITKLLLDHGGSPNLQHRGSPLLVCAIENSACREQPIDLVRLLLDYGARVNARNTKGWTAWMWANALKNLPLMELLVERGANPDLRGPVPLTPQTLAIVREAQSVETFRVAVRFDEHGSLEDANDGWGFPVRITATGPVLGKDFAAKIEALLADYRTYMGSRMKCGFSPSIGFRFHTVTDSVTILICFICHEMLVTTYINAVETSRLMVPFEFVYHDIAALAQTAFPDDPEITALRST